MEYADEYPVDPHLVIGVRVEAGAFDLELLVGALDAPSSVAIGVGVDLAVAIEVDASFLAIVIVVVITPTSGPLVASAGASVFP